MHDVVAHLHTLLRRAEEQRQHGELRAAFESYQQVLQDCLAAANRRQLAHEAVERERMYAMECVADLAVYFATPEVSDLLLASMAMLSAQAGDGYGADYATLKRIHLALGCGLLDDVRTLLNVMRPTLGDLQDIPISPASLCDWETKRPWREMAQEKQAVLFSCLYLVLGRILAANGHYGQALTTLTRGLDHARLEDLALASGVNVPLRLASVEALLESGDLDEARRWLADLQCDVDEQRDPGFALRWRELSAQIHLVKGELGQAWIEFDALADECSQRGFQQAELQAALNLVQVLIYVNQTGYAEEILAHVEEKGRRIGNSRVMAQAAFLRQLAQARDDPHASLVPPAPSVGTIWGAPKPVPASPPGDTELPSIPQAANFLAFFNDRALRFHWHISSYEVSMTANVRALEEGARREAAKARTAADRALEAATEALADLSKFGSTDSLLIHIRLQVMEGILAYHRHNFVLAEEKLSAASSILRRLGLTPELWRVQHLRSRCWTQIYHAFVDPGAQGDNPVALLNTIRQLLPAEVQDIRMEEAGAHLHRISMALLADSEALLDTMTTALPTAAQARWLENKWTWVEEYLADRINQLDRLKEQLTTGASLLRPWRRYLLMKRLNELLMDIEHYRGSLASYRLPLLTKNERAAPPLTLWRRLLSHSGSRATLSFLALPDRVFVASAAWLHLDYSICPVRRAEVSKDLYDWHVNQAAGCQAEARGIAVNLSSRLKLSAILQALPKQVRALTIVPDYSLHGFPLAALMHENKYLVESYSLSLAFIDRSTQAEVIPGISKLAVVVATTQGVAGEDAPRFRELPGAAAELDQVAGWLERHEQPTTRLLDATATKDALIKCLPKARFLHIACHGVFNENQPEQSSLVLIPRPNECENLSLRELSGLNLTSLQHVTLSSCFAADNLTLPGRRIISLPETLWRAGAQSILGCLWEVDDAVAGAFMARFYFYLDQLPRDRALQATQLDCLNCTLPGTEGIDTSNPFYWAGFNLYGDYSLLHL